ncbi:MAG TPA: hypothetical protein HPP83_13090, partial [Candidatus Hydrogenedentes bacterium]|nr:hypothetical protein [Candidatus Hydrogenedentota bacterium]
SGHACAALGAGRKSGAAAVGAGGAAAIPGKSGTMISSRSSTRGAATGCDGMDGAESDSGSGSGGAAGLHPAVPATPAAKSISNKGRFRIKQVSWGYSQNKPPALDEDPAALEISATHILAHRQSRWQILVEDP